MFQGRSSPNAREEDKARFRILLEEIFAHPVGLPRPAQKVIKVVEELRGERTVG
jgi:hypothetical protein